MVGSTIEGPAVPQGGGSGVIDVEDPGRWPLKFDFVFCFLKLVRKSYSSNKDVRPVPQPFLIHFPFPLLSLKRKVQIKDLLIGPNI